MTAFISHSQLELEALLVDLESDRVERKETWEGSAARKGREAICAFANDLPDHRLPGVLFVGVRDDGTPSGLDVSDQLLLTLASIKTDGNVSPPPTLSVEKRRLRGGDVAVVVVQPADAPPVRYDGRIWIRIGPRRGTATAQDERILSEKRKHRDRPFDVQPLPSARVSDLDDVGFQREYLPGAVAADVLAANQRSLEERLASCRMVHAPSDPTPTVVGMLVLGKSPRDWLPGAYVQFLRIQGRELTDPVVDSAEIDGALPQMVRRLDEKLDAHNSIAVEFTSGPTERRSSPYPTVALQQLTRNALMHRTYEGTNAPVKVYWFDDRIEIISPGGPFGIVTSENFGRPGITDYRNPALADAMRVLGFVQRFGMGIALAHQSLQRNGNAPLELTADVSAVLALVRRSP